MKVKTVFIVALLFILSAMTWKVIDNHLEIKIAEDQLRQNNNIAELAPHESQKTNDNSVNIPNKIKRAQSGPLRKPGSATNRKEKRFLANPDEPLNEGFEWTNEYYDPDRIGEPRYREKIMKHLYAKHYYESPQRQMPPFKDSHSLLVKWGIEPKMEDIVIVHDTAVEWHRNLHYAKMDSGPAAGPEAKERVAFMTEFKKNSIRGRLEDLFGIKDEAFMEAFVKIKRKRLINPNYP